MSKAIGFIGLGVMGFPMAGHLSKEHNVFVFNRIWKVAHDDSLIVVMLKPAALFELTEYLRDGDSSCAYCTGYFLVG